MGNGWFSEEPSCSFLSLRNVRPLGEHATQRLKCFMTDLEESPRLHVTREPMLLETNNVESRNISAPYDSTGDHR